MGAAETRAGAAWPLLKTIVFFAIVPGTVAGYLPYAMLRRRGLWVMPELGAASAAGALLILLGAAGLLWCGWHFAVTGRGTPAPFDPPRRLVARGPYRFVRNPMYVSVAIALIGESLFFQTWVLAGYIALFWLIIHLFVLLYEEPTLRGKFGESYAEYCRHVRRWIPRFPGYTAHSVS
jgi:protein-S-isoprenylcysteine O-methyltransferase Ste14